MFQGFKNLNSVSKIPLLPVNKNRNDEQSLGIN